MAGDRTSKPRDATQERRALAGLFLVSFAAYALTGPGRFDSIDTQWRYETAHNLLTHGSIAVRDPALLAIPQYFRAPDGTPHSPYGIVGTLLPVPFMLLGRLLGGAGSDLERFCYALTSAAAGAATATLLGAFYLDLGLSRRRALAWSFAFAFASMLWPLACSTLDNVLHAPFALLALHLAWRAGQRGSTRSAFAAGASAGVLLAFRETFLAIVPGIGLASLGAGPLDRAALRRGAAFGAGASLGLLVFLAYNAVRFGALWPTFGNQPAAVLHPPVLGNPAVGALSLLVSPGRSVILYSPPILLAFAGMATLRRREPALARSILAGSALHFAVIASVSMFAGEWCWGPRYLGLLLPMWALAAPFAVDAGVRRPLVATVLAAGVAVQGLAVSSELGTFYARHRLTNHFWAEDPWFYFRASALLDRPREVIDMVRAERPAHARWFAPTLHVGEPTAAPVRAAEPARWQEVMPLFLVYYVPRPWPFWVPRLARAKRFVPVAPTVAGLLALGVLGALMARRGADERERPGVR